MRHSTQSTILDMGNLQAPEGSVPWWTASRIEAWQVLPELKLVREQVAVVVGALRRNENFRQLTDRKGQDFKTWEEFCCEPYPFGLGMTPEDLDDLLGALAPPASVNSTCPDARRSTTHGLSQSNPSGCQSSSVPSGA